MIQCCLVQRWIPTTSSTDNCQQNHLIHVLLQLHFPEMNVSKLCFLSFGANTLDSVASLNISSSKYAVSPFDSSVFLPLLPFSHAVVQDRLRNKGHDEGQMIETTRETTTTTTTMMTWLMIRTIPHDLMI